MTGWSLLKWTTIGMNILLILWMFATAYAWGGGNWMGASIVSTPPALAIIALLRK